MLSPLVRSANSQKAHFTPVRPSLQTFQLQQYLFWFAPWPSPSLPENVNVVHQVLLLAQATTGKQVNWHRSLSNFEVVFFPTQKLIRGFVLIQDQTTGKLYSAHTLTNAAANDAELILVHCPEYSHFCFTALSDHLNPRVVLTGTDLSMKQKKLLGQQPLKLTGPADFLSRARHHDNTYMTPLGRFN